jgi:hypothetical protein
MSKHNGDRSRFHRLRKAAILRRKLARATYDALKLKAAAGQTAAASGEVREP